MMSLLVLAAALLGYANAVPPPTTCGKPAIAPNLSFMSRVVGGREAKPNSWPWQVQLRYNGNHYCGGSLLSQDWILTAAHCVYGKAASSYSVRAGRHTRTGTGSADKYEQSSSAKQLIAHEGFSSTVLNNDVALIRLSTKMTFNDQVSVVCLTSSEPAGGTQAYVTGWGNVQGTCCDGYLKQALLPIIPRSTCTSSTYWGTSISPGMICAGYADGSQGGCNGDSGGPLVVQNSSTFYQVGIVSWGSRTCTDKNKPTVFANVQHYKKWITNKLTQVEAEEEMVQMKKFHPRLGAAFRAMAQAFEN